MSALRSHRRTKTVPFVQYSQRHPASLWFPLPRAQLHSTPSHNVFLNVLIYVRFFDSDHRGVKCNCLGKLHSPGFSCNRSVVGRPYSSLQVPNAPPSRLSRWRRIIKSKKNQQLRDLTLSAHSILGYLLGLVQGLARDKPKRPRYGLCAKGGGN